MVGAGQVCFMRHSSAFDGTLTTGRKSFGPFVQASTFNHEENKTFLFKAAFNVKYDCARYEFLI